ncbi:putative Ig domain-containing protein [Chryseobacterium tongliaoense]|uniref:putative Ig domain-containing protein n=1 Tax=Chryseobacterium tongliaoense TaxID=3240933 RepID=UPI003517D1DB
MKRHLSYVRKTTLAFFLTFFSVWGWGQITESFESGLPSSYNSTLSSATLSSGSWQIKDVITGTTGATAGTKSAQIRSATAAQIITPTLTGGVGTVSFTVVASTASGGYQVNVSEDNGQTWTPAPGSPFTAGTTSSTRTIAINSATVNKIQVYRTGATLYVDNFTTTVASVSSPSLSTTGTFTSFSYVENNGPSANQSISASGSNLDGSDVTISAPANFEVSLTGGNDFAATKAITGYSNGAFANQNVYVRLKSGLTVGSYSGNLTISGGGLASATSISLGGSVVAVPTVTASSFTGTVGTAFSQNIAATQNPISYALVSGNTLPDGLSLNTSTGAISGTPVTAGTFTADVTATNNAGTSAAATITFTIGKGTQTLTGFSDLTKYLSSPAFSFPANTDAANLQVIYNSSNTAVATISGNTVTIAGVGTTTITATQAGNNNWNAFSQQITLTVANDPVVYNGIGRFEKITSAADLSDGYYVITNETDEFLMTNGRTGTATTGYFVSDNSNVTGNIILNPVQNNVWLIKADGTGTKTIYNEVIGKYVGWSSGNSASIEDAPANTNRWTFTYGSSKFTVNNLATPVRQLSYNNGSPRFAAYGNNAQQELQLFKLVESTIWNGTTWSNGNPDNKDVIITGAYSTNTNPAFTAKNITIKNGGVLEITSGNTVSALDITVENGGNLVQKDGSALNYTGAFKVLKNGISALDKYAFWSSPVADQDLLTVYGTGVTPAFITQYNTATDYFVNAASTIAATGTGYSVKTPVANASLAFEGTPNNGTYTKVLSTAGNGFNLVGNPYPSNLDLNAFYTANTARISNTFYFWDNTSNSVTTQGGATTVNVGYATYNPATQVWVPAPNIVTVPTGNTANVGQGFFVKANNAADTSLSFTNNMRIGNNGTFFNKNVNTLTEGKFWLRLNSSYNTSNTFAVAYLSQASDAYDIYDSKAMAIGSDAFYTLAGTQKLVIQGKAGFDIDDVVPVGAKHFEAGNFTISLTKKEGIFDNGQAIYIHDKELGTYTNLQSGNYTFSANAGDMSTRFEIVYKKLVVLATDEVENSAFEVYRDGEEFVVKNNKNIEKIEIFDASGRKVKQLDANAKSVRLRLDAKGLYILKAISEGKAYTKKLIK